MNKWYENVDDTSDIFISSRIRLARNLQDMKFAPKLSNEEADQLVNRVKEVLPKIKETDVSKRYYGCDVNELSELDRNAMVEKHVISPEFANKKQHTGLILSEDESVSIMINEEDHIRLQVMHNGMNLGDALEEANRLDDVLSEALEYAFDEKLGYLTTCPTNIGTGLRASYMVFLPMLTRAKKMPQLIEEVSKYGITIRGMYGEHSKSMGGLYQISNLKTLGYSEEELIEKLNCFVNQIVQQEKKRRLYLLSTQYDEIEDAVNRSYGILKYAKSISTSEAMSLLADVKFGIDVEILKSFDKANIFRLMMAIQPNNLQWKFTKNVGKVMRDRMRAEYIRNHLPDIEEEATS